MSTKSFYSDYYQSGTAVRKKEYKKVEPKKVVKKVKHTSKVNKASRSSASIFLTIVIIFSMAMLLTYRFNIISEKNLKVQKLKDELAGVEAALATSQIDVEQSTDLNKIEAYAKQQLGMQKPDKNQTIYVDTSKTSKSIEIQEQTSLIDKIIDSIKGFITDIF